MTSHGAVQPFMVLVDDDSHSARLMIRMLLAHGAPSVSWLDGEAAASGELRRLLDDQSATLPALVIVDLKTSSTATADFIGALRQWPGGKELLVAAMAPARDHDVRQLLTAAGADAVFERQADIDFYRRESAAIVSFWVRSQRLEAVGT
jgi:CheY-like chemotaxis protein